MKYAHVSRLSILIFALIFSVSSAPLFAASKLVRYYTRDKALIASLADDGVDIAAAGKGWIDVVVPEGNKLIGSRMAGVRSEVVLDDVDAPFRAFRDKPDLGVYHTVKEVEDEVLEIAAAHPDIVKHVVLGKTYEGRPIHALKITDNPQVHEEDEVEMLFMGAVHAREWIAVEVPMAVARYLTEHYGSDERVTRLVKSREIWVVPAVNLDGINYSQTEYKMWRKTRRDNGDGTFGVDPNRNWGYEWGGAGASTYTSSDTYRGPSAFSEPCITAMRDLCLAHDFVAITDYHSYSQLVLWPWGYTLDDPEDIDFLALHGSRMAGLMGGYTPEQASDLYPCSGVSSDWFYGERGALCYTFELGTQFVPDESLVPSICERGVKAALYMLEECAEPFPMLVHRPLSATTDTEGPYEVTARFNRKHFPDYQLAGVDLLVKEDDGEQVIPMQNTRQSQDVFTASIPSHGYGRIQYRFQVRASDGSSRYYPAEGYYGFDVVDTLYLLVDDDKGKTWEDYYRKALRSLGLPFKVWSVKNEGRGPSAADMLGATAVIWFTGEDSSTTLTAMDQEELSAYLSGGGAFVLFGQDIGYDLKREPFYEKKLHARYVLDKSGSEKLAGHGFLDGMTFSLAEVEGDNVYQSFPEAIEPLDGAVALLDYTGLDRPLTGAVAYESDSCRLAYFGFGLEGIVGAEARRNLLSKSLEWVTAPSVASMVRASSLGRLAAQGNAAARRALDGFWQQLPELVSSRGAGALSGRLSADRPEVAPIVLRRFRSILRRISSGRR